jgi:hypothetical protein
MRPRGRLLAIGLVLACSLSSPARADAVADGVTTAKKALVSQLESLATWCDGSKLAGERDRTFRLILTFEPDHARARAGLKYKRANAKSPWVQAADYREPPDWNKGLLAEAAKRRGDVAKKWLEAGRRSLDDASGPKAAAAREYYLETAIDLAPDEAEFRAARGDVQRDGRWLLAETVEGEKRRRELQEAVKRAAGTSQNGLMDPDRIFNKNWKSAATAGKFNVYGRVAQKETESVAHHMEVTRAFVSGLLGAGGGEPAPTHVILFNNREDARAWIATKDQHKKHWPKIDAVSALWLNDTTYIAYWSSPLLRASGPVKSVTANEISMRFHGRNRGWVHEGLAQRLCWHLLGRHGPGTVDVSGTNQLDADDEASETPLPNDVDRLGPAAATLQRDPGRRMRALLTMNLNAIRLPDSLVAYALASYLLEARPESLRPFLEASMKHDDADTICDQALGVDAETLAWRVRRYAMESTAPR